MEKQLTELTNSLGFIIINTSCSIKDEVRKGFVEKGYDITLDQFAVLIRLWDKDGLSQRELCERTLKTKSNITRILDSMEKKGLIFRQINKEDRRSFGIFLTDQGKAVKDELIPTAVRINSKIFKNINKEDGEVFLKVLNTISNNLK